METKPTHEQAQLQLELYDLRREARLRQAREWFFKNFFAETLEDAMKVAPMGTEQGAFFMMVVSYWDQACAMLNYGLLHEDLFFETSGEFVGVWERIKPTIPEARQRFANKAFVAHLEKAAERFEAWSEKRSPGQMAAMRQMMKMMRPQQAAANA
ncbi:MAG TPA: hypothetical protein VKB26_12890 [Candidatus Acidoferrales bacterium]|nr:hypothetical protein [Candidatus Acidoferrales bacterium]